MQSYLLLQPAAPDPSFAVLQQISSQLASFSINPLFVNSTQPSSTSRASADPPPPVPHWAVWLNALWFAGLILSLASASVGIMVKQWLNEYSAGVSGNSRSVAQMRQYRLIHLRAWHVQDVVNTIPVLLQLALGLFLAGLLILLWSLHETVAAIATTLVCLLAIFTVVTTLLPLVNHKCSYLTPQIRAINCIWQPKRYAYRVCTSISTGHRTVTGILTSAQRMLSTFCRRLRLYLSLAHWKYLWRQARGTTRRLKHIIVSPPEAWRDRKQTWQGRERSDIDNIARRLDTQILVEAYSITLHPDALSAASVCLMGFDSGDVVYYFRQLHKSAREHFGAAADSPHGPLGWGNQQQLLWLQIILCVLRRYHSPLLDNEAAALGVYFACGSWSSGMQAADAEWAISTCNAMSDHLDPAKTSSAVKFINRDRLLIEGRSLLMEHEKPLANALLPGKIVLHSGALRVLTQSPDQPSPGHIARFASNSHASQRRLWTTRRPRIRSTCRMSATF